MFLYVDSKYYHWQMFERFHGEGNKFKKRMAFTIFFVCKIYLELWIEVTKTHVTFVYPIFSTNNYIPLQFIHIPPKKFRTKLKPPIKDFKCLGLVQLALKLIFDQILNLIIKIICKWLLNWFKTEPEWLACQSIANSDT